MADEMKAANDLQKRLLATITGWARDQGGLDQADVLTALCAVTGSHLSALPEQDRLTNFGRYVSKLAEQTTLHVHARPLLATKVAGRG